jgi:hypothetical protein
MLASLLILASTVPPITRIGVSCPLGYYIQSNYCVPSRTITPTTQSVTRMGTSCPLGAYTYNGYCTLHD